MHDHFFLLNWLLFQTENDISKSRDQSERRDLENRLMGLKKSLNKLERQRNVADISVEDVCNSDDSILFHGSLQSKELELGEDISPDLERMESSPLVQTRYCSCDEPSESITVDSERVSLANSDYSLETIKKLCASFEIDDEDIPSFSENIENTSS